MAEIVKAAGIFGGVKERSYDGFTDDRGREVKGGTARSVWFLKSDESDGQPIEIKILDAAKFDAVKAHGNTRPVTVEYSIKASFGKITRTLEAWDAVK